MTNQTIAQVSAELNDQVVDRINGREITRTELTAAFDRVANPTNWKLPIAADVEIKDEWELELILRAVIFFTGGRATSAPVRAGQYRIVGRGYYVECGA